MESGEKRVEYNNLDAIAQAVWAESNLEQKRLLVLDAVSQFQFKKKTDHFVQQITIATNGRRLDKLMSDLALLTTGDRVIK